MCDSEPITSVVLRHNATGKLYLITEKKDYGDPWYMWTEGNYSCDCNRALFINRHFDTDFDEQCGDSRFSMMKLEYNGRDDNIHAVWPEGHNANGWRT